MSRYMIWKTHACAQWHILISSDYTTRLSSAWSHVVIGKRMWMGRDTKLVAPGPNIKAVLLSQLGWRCCVVMSLGCEVFWDYLDLWIVIRNILGHTSFIFMYIWLQFCMLFRLSVFLMYMPIFEAISYINVVLHYWIYYISDVLGVGSMCLYTSAFTIMPMYFPKKDQVAPFVVLSVVFGIGTLCTAQTFSKLCFSAVPECHDFGL